ncbi:MAG: hypothetical protein PF588_02430 [Candidatus Kapabacteria bacterium]|jgi:hypothetical protein|nr:hypothetical protein [Candidatus Kapabacteria bacterium]
MKRFIVLGLVLLSLVFISCDDSSTNTPAQNDSYFPLAVGNSWTYTFDESQETFSLEIVSTVRYFEDVLYQFGSDGEAFDMFPRWRWDNDTLYSHFERVSPFLAQNMKKGDSIVRSTQGDRWVYTTVVLVEETDTELTVNGHKFSDVARIKVTDTEVEGDSVTVRINHNYYAKGVGLIKGSDLLWGEIEMSLLDYHIED